MKDAVKEIFESIKDNTDDINTFEGAVDNKTKNIILILNFLMTILIEK